MGSSMRGTRVRTMAFGLLLEELVFCLLLEELVEELLTCLGVFEGADVVHGSGVGILLGHAAHLHAEVTGFDDDHDTLRVEGILDTMGNFFGHAFLHLQAMAEGVDDACEFGESCNFAVGDVGDVYVSEEGQQVVFTEGVELDVAHNHHVVVALFEEGGAQDGYGIFIVAARKFHPSSGYADGGLEETFT